MALEPYSMVHPKLGRVLAIASLALLNACQAMPAPRKMAGAPAAQQAAAPQAMTAQAVQRPNPATYAVQPASYAAAAMPAMAGSGPVAPAGFHRHAPQRGACNCPHCGPGTLPAFAFSGSSGDEGAMWKPPGIKGPWPHDEYICDGGDLNHDVYVKRDATVVGLDQEDTIGHYETEDGKLEVAASNCICIYAPRFAAVRQVTSPVLQEGHERMADFVLPTKVVQHEEKRGPVVANQPQKLVAQIGLDQAQNFRERNRGLLVDQATTLVLAEDAFLPHEELLFIQRGQFDASEKARLAQRVSAAIVWTENQAVQVLIDGEPAVEARGTSTPEVTYTYEREGKGCLRLCKIADKSEAQSGEIVTFTIRYDNIGDQPISKVTIIDHLMPRLAFVADSAASTVPARFSSQEQLESETLVLRWELEQPLAMGQGGIVRFQARVR